MGASWRVLEAPWGQLGAFWEPLGASLRHLGAILGRVGWSREGLGVSWRHLGSLFGRLGGVCSRRLVFSMIFRLVFEFLRLDSYGGSLKNLEKPEENLGFFDVLNDLLFCTIR